MKTIRFSGVSEAGPFSFDLTNVPDDTTQNDIEDEIVDILNEEQIVPQGNVTVRSIEGTSGKNL